MEGGGGGRRRGRGEETIRLISAIEFRDESDGVKGEVGAITCSDGASDPPATTATTATTTTTTATTGEKAPVIN